ncbi:hypothetical protein Adt_23786 [Abeliophyllum distichum]|uniref:Uncharacterized protein n=1 Tax=Abeliophyllum distichum TaxID=126358 RepID=A0ABD1SC67_9LAMI
MSAKRARRERPLSSSSSEEEDPQIKRFNCCPVLLGKNVDLASITFDALSFHIEDLFVDSILLGRKFDFSYIMILHMNSVLSGTIPKALPYGMILTKVFEHFDDSVHDSVALLPKATDTINISTLKRMKIFKEDGQWVAKS